ncbi:hypothetical protein RSAG8_04695, partial [Rhizoctonia solani AG-8 WAC10335]
MHSFAANEVHIIKLGHHRAETDGTPVVDTLTEGMRQLVHGADGPIAKLNHALVRPQKRRKLLPVSTPWERSVGSAVKLGNIAEDGGTRVQTLDLRGDTQTDNAHYQRISDTPESKKSEDGVEDVEPREQGESSNCSSESSNSTFEGEIGDQDNQFWEEAFDLKFELGDEAFNLFGDANADDEEEEEPEGDELDNDGDSLIDAL